MYILYASELPPSRSLLSVGWALTSVPRKVLQVYTKTLVLAVSSSGSCDFLSDVFFTITWISSLLVIFSSQSGFIVATSLRVLPRVRLICE